MSEQINLFKAIVGQWRNSTALRTIPITSQRVPHAELAGIGGVNLPYCQLEVKASRHWHSSAKYRVTSYRAILTVYVAYDDASLNTIVTNLRALFDYNLAVSLGDDCWVLSVIPEEEDPALSADDYYGEDVRSNHQAFRVLLSETIPAVYSAPST